MARKFGQINEREPLTVADVEGLPEALLPSGAIVLWAETKPPAGWALCDGKKGTPALSVVPAKGKTVHYIQKL